jgi:type III secretion system YscQ/HrcQ family protein
MIGARSFPFDALPQVSREEVSATRAMRAVATALCRPDAIPAAMGELVGDAVTMRVRRVRRHDAANVPADDFGALFSLAEAASLRGAVLVHVEPALASALVARALRQRRPRVVDGSRAPSPEVAGAFAALLHALWRRSHAGAALRVVAAGPAQMLARDLGGEPRGLITTWLSVTVGAEVFDARVSLRAGDLPAPAESRLSRDGLLAMGDAPLALPLVVATCTATRSELGSLRTGDVLLVPGVALEARKGPEAELVGRVALVAPLSERGIEAVLAESARLVIRTERIESHPWDKAPTDEEPRMSGEPPPHAATLDVLEDAPVVVRVELGVVEMKAREWAALSSGDVLALGRKLGAPAILRVGGVEVARGELVQVEGEYGVRILRRGEGSG